MIGHAAAQGHVGGAVDVDAGIGAVVERQHAEIAGLDQGGGGVAGDRRRRVGEQREERQLLRGGQLHPDGLLVAAAGADHHRFRLGQDREVILVEIVVDRVLGVDVLLERIGAGHGGGVGGVLELPLHQRHLDRIDRESRRPEDQRQSGRADDQRVAFFVPEKADQPLQRPHPGSSPACQSSLRGPD
jgi:hypothetical protein